MLSHKLIVHLGDLIVKKQESLKTRVDVNHKLISAYVIKKCSSK